MHTLLTYLMFYKEFSDEEQMKRVVNLLHRIAVKANAPQLFYKASTLDLFKRIWDDKPCLPKTGAYKDLDKLVTFVVKEFFKAAKEYPLMFIEVRAFSTASLS
jgi:replication fork protection complex subunit Tof1/Swi1